MGNDVGPFTWGLFFPLSIEFKVLLGIAAYQCLDARPAVYFGLQIAFVAFRLLNHFDHNYRYLE